MGILIRFVDGPRAGETVEFDDTVSLVVIGRDAARCQVVFPADDPRVGREHCALKRVLDRWRLVLGADHRVMVGSEAAHDEQELEPVAELRLGPAGGPRILVETKGREDLKKTVFQGARRPPPAKVAESAVRQARTNRALVVLSVVLALALGGVGWWSLSRTEERVEGIVRSHQASLDEIRTKQTSLEEHLAEIEPGMKPALKKAYASVYLVLVFEQGTKPVPQATAWVAAPGVLATNAHVAEIFLDLKEGQTMVVRSNQTPPKDFQVERVTIHPGYSEFERVWTDYGPLRDALAGDFEVITNVSACDVGLLHLKESEGLADPIPISPDAEIRKLSSGDLVGFVGYPMESMALGGVNVVQPAPTVQVNRVTAVTDWFGGKDITGKGQLVQHALPATGGASGSPILTSDGKVVAVLSGGNIAMTERGRIPLGVMVNFAQRADLVTELLDETAETLQQNRTRDWEYGIRQFKSRKVVHAEKVEEVRAAILKQWEEKTGRSGSLREEATGELSPPDPMGRGTASARYESLPPGDYLVQAISTASPTDLDLYLEILHEDGTRELFGKDEEKDWFPVISMHLVSPVTLEATVVSPVPGTPYVLRLYEAR